MALSNAVLKAKQARLRKVRTFMQQELRQINAQIKNNAAQIAHNSRVGKKNLKAKDKRKSAQSGRNELGDTDSEEEAELAEFRAVAKKSKAAVASPAGAGASSSANAAAVLADDGSAVMEVDELKDLFDEDMEASFGEASFAEASFVEGTLGEEGAPTSAEKKGKGSRGGRGAAKGAAKTNRNVKKSNK
eukprot:g18512.t1